MVARRLGKLLKRAIVTAKQALGETIPEAIITGTGLGCIENTEKFLVSMLENDEEYLQPTYFMQFHQRARYRHPLQRRHGVGGHLPCRPARHTR